MTVLGVPPILIPPPGGWDIPQVWYIMPKRERVTVSDGSKTDVVRRLKSVEGHVRGVERMVNDGAYCIDVVNQIVAIQRALKRVSGIVLDDHLHSCVTNAMRGPDETMRERVLGELMEVFEVTDRL